MKRIIVDFETYYGPDYTLSLKSMTTEKYIRHPEFKTHGAGIKINEGPSKWVPAKYLPAVFKKIDLENNCLIGHNLQFDGAILAWHYGIVPKLYIDTLSLARSMLGKCIHRHGLTYVSKALCNMDKLDGLAKTYGVRNLPKQLEGTLGDYCAGPVREVNGELKAGDTELTYAIFKRMAPHFPKKELLAQDWVIRAFTCPKLIIDSEMLEQYAVDLEKQKKQALVDAGLETRDLLMSNPKYGKALEELGVTPPTKINKKGQVKYAFAKTDQDHIALLDHPNPQVAALVAARLAHKSTIEQTRTASYLDAAQRGPWPVAYSYAGASITHRFSGNSGGGGNPQNLTRGGTLRQSIMAPPDHVIGVADLSQIECRGTLWCGAQILGPDSEEAKSLRHMAEGGDIYSYFGSKIYGVKISKKTHPKERQIAKSAVLGLGYGMGHARFMDYCGQSGIEIDEQMAKDIVKLYRGTYKGVKKFWRLCQKYVKAMASEEYGYFLPTDDAPILETCPDPLMGEPSIRSPHGLYIKYPNLRVLPEEGLVYGLEGNDPIKLFGGKIAQNIMECITSEIMRSDLVELNRSFDVVMSTHDELVCIVPEDETDNFNTVVEDIMTRPVGYFGGLPLAIETGFAKRYGDAKD